MKLEVEPQPIKKILEKRSKMEFYFTPIHGAWSKIMGCYVMCLPGAEMKKFLIMFVKISRVGKKALKMYYFLVFP